MYFFQRRPPGARCPDPLAFALPGDMGWVLLCHGRQPEGMARTEPQTKFVERKCRVNQPLVEGIAGGVGNQPGRSQFVPVAAQHLGLALE